MRDFYDFGTLVNKIYFFNDKNYFKKLIHVEYLI